MNIGIDIGFLFDEDENKSLKIENIKCLIKSSQNKKIYFFNVYSNIDIIETFKLPLKNDNFFEFYLNTISMNMKEDKILNEFRNEILKKFIADYKIENMYNNGDTSNCMIDDLTKLEASEYNNSEKETSLKYTGVESMLNEIADICSRYIGIKSNLNNFDALLIDLSKSISYLKTNKDIDKYVKNLQKTIIYDFTVVSEEVRGGYVTGIQKVSMELYKSMLKKGNVVPICVNIHNGEAILYKIDDKTYQVTNEIITVNRDNVYFSPEINDNDIIRNKLQKMLILRKIKKYALVYDILPLQHPKCFVEGGDKVFKDYLNCSIQSCSGVIGISKVVMNDVVEYIKDNHIKQCSNQKYGYSHCGVTIETRDCNAVDKKIEKFFKNNNVYLMVGTIEPRKSHEFVLDCFKKLWKSNKNVKLCFIGRVGWKSENVINKIKNLKHEKQFRFYEEAPDEVLNYAYNNATALIQASKGEGFGLPLIEAGAYNLPIIASDIPVFREVAGENALYFGVDNEDSFMACIETFINMKEKGIVPQSNKIKYQSWDDMGEQIIDMIVYNKWNNSSI